LTVINSTYSLLDSSAWSTKTITTATVEEDPVQYVRARFADVLGRDPDAAAHFFWSDLLINCLDDAACQSLTKEALENYLAQDPATVFAITGHVNDEQNNPLTGATVTLSGSQSVTTTTDANGNYVFANLPTSGQYLVTPSQTDVVFDPAIFVTPSGDQVANFVAKPKPPEIKKYSLSGRVLSVNGEPMPGVVVTLSGAVNRATMTSGDGSYSFPEIDAGASCTVSAAKDGYLMSPVVQTFKALSANTVADFQATQLPLLLTISDSDRAVALELTQLIPEPFPITTTLLSEGRNQTRIMVFGTNLGLLEGEGVEVMTAEAEDSEHVIHPLRVELVTPLAGTPGINQIVLRLTSDLEDAGDVFVTVKVKGLASNKVRIAIAR
jgi:carboxypeptidase family protein